MGLPSGVLPRARPLPLPNGPRVLGWRLAAALLWLHACLSHRGLEGEEMRMPTPRATCAAFLSSTSSSRLRCLCRPLDSSHHPTASRRPHPHHQSSSHPPHPPHHSHSSSARCSTKTPAATAPLNRFKAPTPPRPDSSTFSARPSLRSTSTTAATSRWGRCGRCSSACSPTRHARPLPR